MSAPILPPTPALNPEMVCPPEAIPPVDHLVTEDDIPVDNIYVERQEQLLVSPLYDSWSGPGENRTFIAMANVGMFFARDEPPLVPDALLSLDVRLPPTLHEKRYRSYFFWEFGKAPDVCVEVVSNLVGEELGKKLRMYAQLGVPYYVVWDPLALLGHPRLRVFGLRVRSYEPIEAAQFPALGLGMQVWHGHFRDMDDDWLRWVDANGQILATGGELAEQERQRAEQERERADKLAAQLRALGVEPQE
jgi:Uma2 family endonuclease